MNIMLINVIYIYIYIYVFSHQNPKLIGASIAPDPRIRASAMLILLTIQNLELGNLENTKWTKLNYNMKHQNVCFFGGRQT
jgi:hypothetical protein